MEIEIGNKKYGVKTVLIDDEDFILFNKYNWNIWYDKSTKGFYCINSRKNKSTLRLHRYLVNCPDGFEVDHINHNTLDNRRRNLRICSKAENQRNQRLKDNNTSGFKGVYWKKQDKKYVSQITLDGKRLHIGYYKTAKEAAFHYNHYANILFGEFACLNNIG
jgi:hypothetical protein